MRDHFARIDRARVAHGERPLHELLIDLLAAAEHKSGTVRKILRAEKRLRKALPESEVKRWLDVEAMFTGRLVESETIAFNLGFEYGAARAQAAAVEDPRVRQLTVQIGETLAGGDAQVHEIVQALSIVIIGAVKPVEGDAGR